MGIDATNVPEISGGVCGVCVLSHPLSLEMELHCTAFWGKASDVMCTAMLPLILHGCKGIAYRIAKEYEYVSCA